MSLPASVVDQFADILIKDLQTDDWVGMRDRISGTAEALQQIHDTRDPSIHAGSMVPVVVAAAIDKLGSPEVDDVLQAYLWTLSVKPLHRARGSAWLFAHPDESATLERDTADEHIAVILEGRSVQDEAERMLPDLPARTVRFAALHDEEAGVWVATSDDHITTEAPSRDELLERLKAIVPDVLEAREGRTGPLTIVVAWQELRTVDQTTLAVA